jgi:hypothetical protein
MDGIFRAIALPRVNEDEPATSSRPPLCCFSNDVQNALVRYG